MQLAKTTPEEDARANARTMLSYQSPRLRRMNDKKSSFRKGSNIPCLSSEELPVIPKPSLPLTRVRDLGKEILARENRSTWFEGMITEREVCAKPGQAVEAERADVIGDKLDSLEGEQREICEQQEDKEDCSESLSVVNSESANSSSVNSNPENDTGATSSSKNWSFQRRLRGDVAKQCARRDEGCLKNLIWYQEGQGKKGDSVLQENNTVKVQEPQSVEKRKLHAFKAGESDSMKHLLTDCSGSPPKRH